MAAAQVAHAAGFSAARYGKDLPIDTHVVVLEAPDEGALRMLVERLPEACGVIPVVEDAAPYSGQLMSVGFLPTTDRQLIRQHTSSLPLFGTRLRRVLEAAYKNV